MWRLTAGWIMKVSLLVAFAWVLAARAAAFQSSAHPENAPEAVLKRSRTRGGIGETERQLAEPRK
jgi:hypothetical protein